MSASFTFGSFGDIITTVQLVWRLSQAISESHGSAQEFRDLVKELNLFYAALHEVGFHSRRTIGDVFKRIRWSILEKEKVAQLRDKLRQNKDLVDIVQASALR
ncbi:hypothetical protein KJ359_008442 [Pestalotiopsis sp. 9143b]|nr:hypothetical protein KJ359_008442 [Pestalotiopsis sp. 9143b]